MGIELLWGAAKREYRSCVTSLLAHGEPWTQSILIRDILREIETDKVKAFAATGLRRLHAAMPVDPKPLQEAYTEKEEPPVHNTFLQAVWGVKQEQNE